MRTLLAILLPCLFSTLAVAQPVCTSQAPNAVACQATATDLQPTDVLFGEQATGPNRENQSVKVPMSAVLQPDNNLSEIAANGSAAQAAARANLGISTAATIPTAINLSNFTADSNTANGLVGTVLVTSSTTTPFSGSIHVATAPQAASGNFGGCATGSDANNNNIFLIAIGGVTYLEENGIQQPSATRGAELICLSAMQNGVIGYQSFAVSFVLNPGPSSARWNAPFYTCNTNYYVSTTGSDSNPGTQTQPWATWQAADNNGKSGPGVCVNFLAGSWSVGIVPVTGGNASSATGFMVYRCAVPPVPVGTARTATNSCINTDDGSGTGLGNGPIEFHCELAPYCANSNFIVFDGFTFPAATQQQYGEGLTIYKSSIASTVHHIVMINNDISNFGEAGISSELSDFNWFLHNRVHNNGALGGNCTAQGSGLTIASPILFPGYTPVTFDYNNPLIGNVTAVGQNGQPVNNVIAYNVVNNNAVSACTSDSDGNGIILDSWNTVNVPNPYVTYTGGALLFNNVAFNNGGIGVHVFLASPATVANNSVYNNNQDPYNPYDYRGGIDDNGSQGPTTFINNIGVAIPGAYVPYNGNFQYNNQPYTIFNSPYLFEPLSGGAQALQTGLLADMALGATSITVIPNTNFPVGHPFTASIGNHAFVVGSVSGGTWSITPAALGTTPTYPAAVHTTLANAGGINNSATSLTLTSATGFPAAGPYTLIIGTEAIQVNGGYGTTTLTGLVRGYNNTTAASHAQNAAISATLVTFVPDYVTNNIAWLEGGHIGGWGIFYSFLGYYDFLSGSVAFGNGTIWSTSSNMTNTNPAWRNVGNVSPGVAANWYGQPASKPNGSDFSLLPGSPAIGCGVNPVPAYLPWWDADCGAVYSGVLSATE